jgi:hypothetical protein
MNCATIAITVAVHAAACLVAFSPPTWFARTPGAADADVQASSLEGDPATGERNR